MSDVQLVETVDEEGFDAADPYTTKTLLGSIAWGAITKGVDNVEGAHEAEGVVEEWAPDGVAILDGAVDAGRGMKEVFVVIGWWPYNSFLANKQAGTND
jgi:hypothetical protein